MLFRPNIVDPGQVAALVASLRAAAPPEAPLLVSIDQEGGVVQRLRAPATVWPPMLAVGGAGDTARTTAVGRALGEELAALGVGWDFAPVLDVHTNPANPVIGNRAFGTTPETVAAQAVAFWRGLRGAGLVGCGKHFPGHGDTRTDSHHELPVVSHELDWLRRVELAPFAAAAAVGMEAFMTAHVLYPALNPDWPATLSRRIATELLRGELGFRGVLVSDDLGMKAVADCYSIRGAGGRRDRGRLRPPPDPRARGAPAGSPRSDRPRRRSAGRLPGPGRGERRARRCAQGRLPGRAPRARRDVAVPARHAGAPGSGGVFRCGAAVGCRELPRC